MNPGSAVIHYIQSLSFDEREQIIKAWQYKKSRAWRGKRNTLGCNRNKAMNHYYYMFNVDNLYEYCVFRNTIYVLNQYARKLSADGNPMKLGFNLGHWLPMAQGGVHLPSNWIIQVVRENTAQGDKATGIDLKWDFDNQIRYINANIDQSDVDKDYEKSVSYYLKLLKEVY